MRRRLSTMHRFDSSTRERDSSTSSWLDAITAMKKACGPIAGSTSE